MAEIVADEPAEAALVTGLHSVTFSCADARANNRFWTEILGLRRVKQTVDYDCPDCYRLYYGDETGTAGTLISAVARPKSGHERPPAAQREEEGRRRAGRHYAVLAVRCGALPFWRRRLQKYGLKVSAKRRFGAEHLCFCGPCGERLELAENPDETRCGYVCPQRGITAENAVCGLYALSLAVCDKDSAAGFLQFLGFRRQKSEGGTSRFVLPPQTPENGARIIDVEQAARGKTEAKPAAAGLEPGAVAHIAFAAHGALDRLEEILLDKGYKVGGYRDNVYYSSFYIYAPQGAAAEMAAAVPDFAKDESKARLGSVLCLPRGLEHLRHFIEGRLEKLPE